MKAEKTALWCELTLFTEQEKGKRGYLGFIRGVFNGDTLEADTSQIQMDDEARYEYETLLCFLRSEQGHYLLKNKTAMEAFCRTHLQCHIPYAYGRECWGFRVLTDKRVWYIACSPWNENKQFCICVYDRTVLMRELAEARQLPQVCYAVNPFDWTRILIRFGDTAFEDFPQYGTDKLENERYAAEQNKELKVTKQQAAAMLGGVIYGWESPLALLSNYDKDGCYRPPETKHKRRKDKRYA